MLDDRVRSVLAQLEKADAAERAAGLPSSQRARQVSATTGRFLFALVASHPGCRVLEIGGSRGYSGIWLGAAARMCGGRVLSLEHDPPRCEAWRKNISAAGLDEWAELACGDAFATLQNLEGGFAIAFLDAEKDDYETLFGVARPLVVAGGLVVADNVLSHVETLGAYSAARQADETLCSVTVPLDRGLELTVVLP
jgi:predicted O-methyltransferase YrrM